MNNFSYAISPEEASIICNAVELADREGSGRFTKAEKMIKEAGYNWSLKYEIFMYEENLF